MLKWYAGKVSDMEAIQDEGWPQKTDDLFAAVAKLRERFSAEMKTDRSLRKQLERITGELSNVKGLFWS